VSSKTQKEKRKKKKKTFNIIGVFHLERRIETEGVSKSEDIEINPKADSQPGTNQAQSCLTQVLR
jgi:hypothetical protein